VSVGTAVHDLRPPASADASRGRALLTPAAAAVAALTVLAALLRFTRIGHQGFWFDEGNTALLVHFSPGKMLGLIPQSESTPPLYYCVAWAWARVFGYGEAGLRSLSALAGVLTVPVAYGAATKLISRRAGLIAGALTACNPLLIWYSQEARSYSLLVLLSATALLAFAHARATPTPRTLLAWVIAAALALATHYYALLVIVPQAVWLLALHWRRRPVQIAIGALGVCGLALIPLAISQNGTGHASWIAAIPLGPRLAQIFPQFLIGVSAPDQDVLYPVAALAVLVGLVLLIVRSEPLQRQASLAVGALAVGGLIINLVLVAGGIDDLITRNVIVLWLPAAVMLAGGLGAKRAGVLGLAAAALLCAVGVCAAVGVASERRLERPDWRAVAGVLGARPRVGAGGRAILVQHYRDLLPLSLYLPGLRFMPRGGEPVRELDVVSISAPRVALCWWGAACNLSPSQLQSSYPVPGFHELWRKRALQFTIVRLVSDRPVVLTGRDVSPVLTTTTLRRDELLFQR
jgi:mannosyltransferase